MPQPVPAAPRLKALDLAYVAFFSALIAVCAWLSVPMPKPFVPFTMQTFGVFAALICLDGRRGFYSVLTYLMLGAVGLPVFTGFRGGAGVLFDATGGYLIGFLALALVYWTLRAKIGAIAACVVGLALCYAFGTAWFVALYASAKGPIGVGTALGWCVAPFVIPDALKLCLASLLSRRVSPLMK